jgi:hypothetical protein
VQLSLDAEIAEHDDILIVDTVDIYRRLARKLRLAYRCRRTYDHLYVETVELMIQKHAENSHATTAATTEPLPS